MGRLAVAASSGFSEVRKVLTTSGHALRSLQSDFLSLGVLAA